MTKIGQVRMYVDKAIELGALSAKLIRVDTIVTGEWVRLKCQYGCTGYGQRLMCPPHSPTPDQTAKVLACYTSAILMHGNDHTDITDIASTIERQAFLGGYHKAFAMGSGPCRQCVECNIDAGTCRHPAEARPSMEACGLDVFQTVRNNGFSIDVVATEDGQPDYYALLLLE